MKRNYDPCAGCDPINLNRPSSQCRNCYRAADKDRRKLRLAVLRLERKLKGKP